MENRYYLSGERIYLREVRGADVNDRYYDWMNDSEITQYLEVRFQPQSMESIHEYVKKMNEIGRASCRERV